MGTGSRRALVVALIATLMTFAIPSPVISPEALAAIPAPSDVIGGSPDLNIDGSTINGGAGVTACYTVPSGVSQVDVEVLGQGGMPGAVASSGFPAHTAGKAGVGQWIHARIPVTPGQVLLAEVPPMLGDTHVEGDGRGYGGGFSWIANIEPGITCSHFGIAGIDQWAGNDVHPANASSYLVLAGGGGGGGGMGSSSSGGNGGNAGMPAGTEGQAGGANDRKDGSGGGGGSQTDGGFGGHSGCYFSSDFTTHCAYNGSAGSFLTGGAGGQFLFGDGTNGQGGEGGRGWYGGGGGASSINDGGAGGGGGGSSHVAANVTVLETGLGTLRGYTQSNGPFIKIAAVIKPSVVLTSSHNPSSQGSTVTFTATVNPAVEGTIEFDVDIASQQCSVLYYDPFTGQDVTFCIPLSYTTLADVALVNGVATLTTSSLGIRNNIITANFLAHDLYDGAYAQVTQTVVAGVSIINQSTDQTAVYGDNFTFAYGAPGGTSQQWQVAHVTSTTPTVTYGPWSDIPGATSNVLTLPAKENLAKYRSLVTNGADTIMTREFLLHVTPAPLQVVGTSQTVQWGTAPAALTATLNGLKFNDNLASFTGSVTVTSPTLSTNVGSYPIHVTGTLANPNYGPITYADTGAVTVTKRTVTITANELTSEYGTPPEFTAHASGLLSPDTLAGLGTLTFIPTPAPIEDLTYFQPADYQVTPGGLPDNAHYAFTYAPAAWHVRDTTGPSAPTITSAIPNLSPQLVRVGPTTFVGYGQIALSWSYAPDLWGTVRYLGVQVDCTTHQVVSQIFDTQIAKFGWVVTIPIYPEATRCISIQGVDGFGNVGQVSEPYTFITDFTPPAVSVAFAPGTIFIPAASPNPAFTGNTTPTVQVTTEANANLTVNILDASGNVLMTAITTTGPSGVFAFAPTTPLPEGLVTVVADASDQAGNGSEARFPFIVDNTPPSVTSSRTAPNANGWNNGPVLVSFTATDAAAGMAPGTDRFTLTLSGDGADQIASRTFTDLAGNAGSASVTGINIDRTAPTIGGARTPANANGWNNGPVTVSFSCADALSGLDTCAPSQTVSAEGAAQSATGTAKDKAGNTATATVSGINIDLTPPELTVQRVPTPNANGWNNATVAVAFSCLDRLSGLADCPDVFFIGEGADQSVTGTSTDKAGNTASLTVTGINVDKTKPTITASPTAPNAAGWNNTDVVVSFTCGDALSGVALCASPVTLSGEGASQSATGGATDRAGNSATATASGINIDKTAPSIASSGTAPNGAGWNNTDVVVSFSCSDALSGIASCGAPVTLGEGASQSAPGTAVDRAGNTKSLTVTGINVDKTAPTITGSRTAPNANGWNNTDVVVSFTCDDALSGVATCAASQTLVADGANQSASGGVVDVAGNATNTTVSGINIDKSAPTISASATTNDGAAYVANTWTGRSVTVHFTCADALSGIGSCPADVTVSADGADQSMTATATDRAGNSTSATFAHIFVDKIAPVLSLPADMSVDSTATTGAVVTYVATATDNHSAPRVACTPVSGSTFADGNTTVTCTATDAVGNVSSGTFQIHVNAPAQQMTNETSYITANGLDQGTSLGSKLGAAQVSFQAGDTTTSCNQLNAFKNEIRAQSGKKLTTAQAAQLLADADRIKSSMGCTR